MKSLIRALTPAFILDRYHWALAKLAAAKFGYPSEKMIVVGVTGTNGKTTVSNMIGRIMEEAGHKVGVATTVNFKVADKERLNDAKMTMLGRTKLQALMAEMVSAGCTYAVIETSSEGIKQHRHVGIHYDAAVFTNLTPEHLESHGGFENYKKAKGELFAKLARDPMKVIGGVKIPKVSVVNLDSLHAPYYLSFGANKKYGFLVDRAAAVKVAGANGMYGTHAGGMTDAEGKPKEIQYPLGIVKALDVSVTPRGSTFTVRGTPFRVHMLGLHNVENALAAIAYGMSQGVPLQTMSAALEKLQGVPGRLEAITVGPRQDFDVLVDYAPEPESMRRLYEVVAMLPHKRVIHILGSAGGGRDKDRRPVLGTMAGSGADVVIVTNEDPYDEDPHGIMEQVAEGARRVGKEEGKSLFVIDDRGEAIARAVGMAQVGDLLIVTGKGAEQAICVANGGKIPWDDREKLRAALRARFGIEADAASAPSPAQGEINH
ncbi:MAG: hypothetical protein RLZZ324_397 [Candidatus Parcubacteria bacterium]|jgi:UDP-N-acetylmuramoyl-L-alanyl-D-glutamate--2,6-diaminopimelate ligase